DPGAGDAARPTEIAAPTDLIPGGASLDLLEHMFYTRSMAALSPAVQQIEDTLGRQAELLDEWVAVGAQIGALEAQRAELLAARLDLLVQERGGSDEVAFRSMCAEYAAAGHVSPSTFAEHMSAA